ncbi:hypothetical protein ACMGDH_12285 [Sphingomonas sp. DT-207]|uniref:hypothetical protein n=1 Tax=Sphingomonas sp. DT-207 TaxID=3396167 RepID=UPI003F1C00BA
MTPEPASDDLAGTRPPSSLAERLVQRARTRAARAPTTAPPADWRVALAIAGLILSAPLLTIVGAKLLTGGAEREASALSTQLAPRIAAQREAEAAHQRLADALRGPGPSGTIEALARTLPAEAKIARLAREPGGAIDLEVAAPDPDRLRSALRRAPEFARVRDAGQRAGDGEMISRFRIAAP